MEEGLFYKSLVVGYDGKYEEEKKIKAKETEPGIKLEES